MSPRPVFLRGWPALLLAITLTACGQSAPPAPAFTEDTPNPAPFQAQAVYRGQLYLSDLSWTSAVSGYGPVERDRANGTDAPNDGGPLIIEGQTFRKGLGVHSNSAVVYPLGGTCSAFNAAAGLNDYKLGDALGSSGSVVFQVYLDGQKVFDSGVMRGNSPALPVSLSLQGKRQLRLVTTDAGDGRTNDHADWADARLACTADDQIGVGLSAQYYAAPDFGGSPVERLDPTVNYDWLEGAPIAGLGSDGFSVRWTGKVKARYSENYTFMTVSDDNLRLWVNGQLIIDGLSVHPLQEQRGTVSLVAGQAADLKLEYHDVSGPATVRLLWSSPSQAPEVVPRSQLTPARPSVTGMLPVQGSANVRRDSAVTANLFLSTPGSGVNAATLPGNVLLYRSDDAARTPLAGNAGTDGADGNITFQPAAMLEANTYYTFEVTGGVKDGAGAAFIPFRGRFATGPEPFAVAPSVNFSRKQVYPDPAAGAAASPISSITVDPSGSHLYGVTLDGKVLRWPILPSGDLVNPPQVLALAQLVGRAIVGMRFDPTNARVLWISHNAPLDPQPAPDFSGKVSRLTLGSAADFTADLQDYVVGLPRSIKDHMTNSLAFGPDGALYLAQGSNSSAGAQDNTWLRPERLLSGAVLQIDPRRTAGLPINVQTEAYGGLPGSYNPYAADAPVRIYASGVRNAYDLVWHSNGSLYLPTNGSAAGGSTPASPDGAVPALTNIATQPDYLLRTKAAGSYFGHPNPLRGQYVLNGGNPTSGVDPAEVVSLSPYPGYPVGVAPDPNYRWPTWNFGYNRSPDGAIEYKSATFGGALKNRLLVVEYSAGDDLLALTLDAAGNVSRAEKIGLGEGALLANPLDLAENGRNGHLYVVELVRPTSSSRVTLLTPAP